MFNDIYHTLSSYGVFTLLLTVLIIIIFSVIVVLFFKVLYKSSTYGYPSTMKRLFAFLFDMIQLNLVVLAAALIYFLATGTLLESLKQYGEHLNSSEEFHYYTGKDVIKSDFYRFEFYVIILFSFYSFVMEVLGKNTRGKSFMGIEIGEEGGDKPAFWQTLVRNTVKVPVLMVWPAFLVLSLMSEKRRWAHDLVSLSVLRSVKV